MIIKQIFRNNCGILMFWALFLTSILWVKNFIFSTFFPATFVLKNKVWNLISFHNKRQIFKVSKAVGSKTWVMCGVNSKVF
jgi:hypothetical protein